MNKVTIIGKTNFRDDKRLFGILQPDRLFHTYIIGKTGTGKSTLIKNMAMQDITTGEGLALLDPHGDLVEDIYRGLDENQRENCIYVNLGTKGQPYFYNPLKSVPAQYRPLVASGLLGVFERLYKDAWGARIEHVLRYCILALLDYPHADISCITRLLNDKSFRGKVIPYIKDNAVRDFWVLEFKRYKPEMLLPVANKLGGLMSYPAIKGFLMENKTAISFRAAMDKGKILLFNLSKGIVGEDASHLVGSVIVSSIGMAAFSRANVAEAERRPFMVYADEFQNFSGSNLMSMLSELRKYKVGLVLAHQYIAQLDQEIRDAVLGNIGTLVSFRLGPQDATFIAKSFFPVFDMVDFINLQNYHVYIKLMIEGKVSKAFSATTLSGNYKH
jgi:hypothetical protein